MPRPLSMSAATVLHAISAGVRYGFEIMEATRLPSGTVYPVLSRLERSGLVRGKWERTRVARKEKRPARRYYSITADGTKQLERTLEHFRTLGGQLARTGAVEEAEAQGGH